MLFIKQNNALLTNNTYSPMPCLGMVRQAISKVAASTDTTIPQQQDNNQHWTAA